MSRNASRDQRRDAPSRFVAEFEPVLAEMAHGRHLAGVRNDEGVLVCPGCGATEREIRDDLAEWAAEASALWAESPFG